MAGQTLEVRKSAQPLNPKLSTAELILRRKLSQAGSSPFIAHIDLDEKLSLGLRAAAADFVRGQGDRVPRLIQVSPACGLWLLVRAIRENYGRDEGNAIYPCIAEAFGVSGEIHHSCREHLNREFRRACRKFGLAVAGYRPVGYVDDYIFQAGVTRRHLGALIDAFLQAEAGLGPPPDDDTQRLFGWQEQATEFAPWSLTRLRNVLQGDETAYHAQCFARLRRGEGSNHGFEIAVAAELERCLASSTGARIERLAFPTLVFYDDAVALAAPPGAAVVASVGGRERSIPAGGRLTLPLPWPAALAWKRPDKAGPTPMPVPILSGDRKLLAFDAETGRFLKAITSFAEQTPVHLDAREVTLVAQTSFRAAGEHAIPLGRQAFGLVVTLTERVAIEVGNDKLWISPPSRPLLDVEVSRFGRGSSGPLCGRPHSVRVRFPGGRPEGRLKLVVEHPAMVEQLHLPLETGDDLNIDLGCVLPERGPVGLLRIHLVFAAGERTLVRSSHWVWPGLLGFVDGARFDAPSLPPNLVLDQSKHVAQFGGHLSLVLDDQYRTAELVFRMESDRLVSFEFSRPGVTVALVSDDGTERFVPFGSTVAAGGDSTDSLVIRNTFGNAALDVRGRVEPDAFGRTGVRRIAVAALTGASDHDEIRILPHGRPEASRVLVKTAPTTAPLTFAIEKNPRTRHFDLKLSFAQPVDGVTLASINLATEERVEAALALGRIPVEIAHRGLLSGAIVGADRQSAEISIHTAALPAGLWTGELLIRNEGDDRWMPIVNARGDRYLIGLAGREQPANLPTDRVLFQRLTDALNRCVAVECWPSYGILVETLWRQTGKRLTNSPENKQALLAAIGRPLPLDSSSTWVPLRHPIELAPDLFSANANDFSYLADSDVEGIAELAAIASTAGMVRVREAVGPGVSLHFSVALRILKRPAGNQMSDSATSSSVVTAKRFAGSRMSGGCFGVRGTADYQPPITRGVSTSS